MSETYVWPKSNTKKLKCCFRPSCLEQKAKEEQPIAIPLMFLHILLSILTLGSVKILGSFYEKSPTTGNVECTDLQEKLMCNLGANLSSTTRAYSHTTKSNKVHFAGKILQHISKLLAALKQKLDFSHKTKPNQQVFSTTTNLEKKMLRSHREIIPNTKNISIANADPPSKERANLFHEKEVVLFERLKLNDGETPSTQIAINSEKGKTEDAKTTFGDNLGETKQVNTVKAITALIKSETLDAKIATTSKPLTIDRCTSIDPTCFKKQSRTSVASVGKVKKIFKKVFPKLSKKRSISIASGRSKSKVSLMSTCSETTSTKKCTSDTCIFIPPISGFEIVAPNNERVSEQSADEVSINLELSCNSETTPEISSITSSNVTSTSTIDSPSTSEIENKSKTSRSDAFCFGDAPQKDEDKTSFKGLDFSEIWEDDMAKEKFCLKRIDRRSHSELPNLFQTVWVFPEKVKINRAQYNVTKPTRTFAFHDGKMRRNQKTITPVESAV